MPKIIQAFQRDYPGIQYELLLGDYGEIEAWIAEGRVECGFLRLPTRSEFETIPLERDERYVRVFAAFLSDPFQIYLLIEGR